MGVAYLLQGCGSSGLQPNDPIKVSNSEISCGVRSSKSTVAIGILVCVLIYSNNLNRAKNLSHNLDPLYSLSKNKWYVDELYHKLFVLTFFKLANFFWKRGDEKTIDGLGPNGVSWIISKSSSYVSLFQSGYLFHYAFAMLGGLVIILTWFLYY